MATDHELARPGDLITAEFINRLIDNLRDHEKRLTALERVVHMPQPGTDDLSGEHRIRVKANGRFLHEDGLGDRLVSTRHQVDDDFTRFIFQRQPDGSYRIRVKANGRFLHEDGLGDRLVSTRAQDDDDFTRFILERQPDGSYRIQVKANGRFLHEDGLGDQLVSTRHQVDDDFTRFFLE